jgi:hypothetical protein
MAIRIESLKHVKDERGRVVMSRWGTDGKQQHIVSFCIPDVPTMHDESGLTEWWAGVEQELRTFPNLAEYILDLPLSEKTTASGVRDFAVILPIPHGVLTQRSDKVLTTVVPQIKEATLTAVRREDNTPGPKGLEWR